MAKLVLERVKRRYPGASEPALRGIDLTVEDGEVLVLVGPSGCGKSTALRLIAGLDLPDGGTISLDGKDLAAVPPQERDVAMVFQGYALYPHMTVEENLAFPLKMRGVAKVERARKVKETVRRLDIEALLPRLPSELSGGQRQRVAMGRALVREPRIFLFDEPLSNLDAALRASLRVEIARLMRAVGATAIYVTHDQVEAMTVGDRIAVMRDGLIEQIGPPRTIYEKPSTAFVATFVGTPAINLWRARVNEGRARVAGAELDVPAAFADRSEASIGVRPEHVRVVDSSAAPAGPGLSLRAKVIGSEPLGSETIVHAEAGEGDERVEVRAKVHGFFDAKIGDEVGIAIDPARVFWFPVEAGA
ncbi:MAG: ABC transporter ATP-binding protein [Polyangiaceae bacterium]|nr:ABC transporter ATP-binding protein [Polyangiaceae bacterium]